MSEKNSPTTGAPSLPLELNENGCEHTGSFRGVGQSVIRSSKGLMVISSAVCGQCGQFQISVNNINLELPQDSGIKVPSMPRILQ